MKVFVMKLLHCIANLFHSSKYTSNEESADIIRRFINGTASTPYEWDDFEVIEERNPEANLAIKLCWYYANKYPPDAKTKYCGEEASHYFLQVANALEKNLFKDVDIGKALLLLEKGKLSDDIIKLEKNRYQPREEGENRGERDEV
jgi:hypothetical protein